MFKMRISSVCKMDFQVHVKVRMHDCIPFLAEPAQHDTTTFEVDGMV